MKIQDKISYHFGKMLNGISDFISSISIWPEEKEIDSIIREKNSIFESLVDFGRYTINVLLQTTLFYIVLKYLFHRNTLQWFMVPYPFYFNIFCLMFAFFLTMIITLFYKPISKDSKADVFAVVIAIIKKIYTYIFLMVLLGLLIGVLLGESINLQFTEETFPVISFILVGLFATIELILFNFGKFIYCMKNTYEIKQGFFHKLLLMLLLLFALIVSIGASGFITVFSVAIIETFLTYFF